MKLKWSERAQRDLLEIHRYIARDDPKTVGSWLERLRQRARRVAQMPRAGRVVPELGRREVCEVLVGNYRIVYLVGKHDMTVLTVFECHRLLRP